MVNVHVARDDVARPPPDLGADEPNGEADEAEADHERHEEAEQWQPAGTHDLLLEPTGHDNLCWRAATELWSIVGAPQPAPA